MHGGEPIGVYLRSTGQDVVLDVTHQGGSQYRFAGTLTSDGVLRASSSKIRPRDKYSVSPDGHTFTFDFKNYGGITGVHLTSKCGSSLTLQATSGKKARSPEALRGRQGERADDAGTDFRAEKAFRMVGRSRDLHSQQLRSVVTVEDLTMRSRET